jgi:hypothetical protein
MRGLIQTLLAAALIWAAPTAGQPLEERTRLDWVQQRGRLLFEIDRAAWVATDDLRARVPDLAGSGIRGWTVEREGAGYGVIFFAGEGDARVAAYRARVENNRVVAAELIAPGSRPPLTPLQRRLADARGMVARLSQRPCSPAPFNVAVIPPAGPDAPIDVYALTPQTNARIFPFGGHYRATITSSGEILSQRGFMRSCFDAPLPPEGNRPEALFLTHFLDQTPTEIHVFMSIWMNIPVVVGTSEPRRLWQVDRDRIGPPMPVAPSN